MPNGSAGTTSSPLYRPAESTVWLPTAPIISRATSRKPSSTRSRRWSGRLGREWAWREPWRARGSYRGPRPSGRAAPAEAEQRISFGREIVAAIVEARSVGEEQVVIFHL